MNTELKSRTISSARPISRAVRLGTAVVCGAHLLTVLVGLWLALLASQHVLWTSMGFEFVALGAGVFGLLAGLGRFKEGFALGLLCVAGAVMVTGVFGLHFSAGPTLRSAALSGDAHASAVGVLSMVVKARVGLSGLIVALAALSVLTQSRASWRPLWTGLLMLIPVGIIAIWLVRFGGAGKLVGDSESAMGVARLIASLFGGLVLFVIAAIGGHYVLKAFDSSPTPPAQGSADS